MAAKIDRYLSLPPVKVVEPIKDLPPVNLSNPNIGDPSADTSYTISDNTENRVIYRACHPQRGQSYIDTRDSSYITQQDPTGDFHKDNNTSGCTYWTTDLWYAYEICHQDSLIIAITLPANFHFQFEKTKKYCRFTSAVTYLWQQTVTSNRKGETNPDSKINTLQNLDMIEGPTSNAHTANYSLDKPAKVRGWQVAFRVSGLEPLNKLPVTKLGTKNSPEVALAMKNMKVPTKKF